MLIEAMAEMGWKMPRGIKNLRSPIEIEDSPRGSNGSRLAIEDAVEIPADVDRALLEAKEVWVSNFRKAMRTLNVRS